VAKFAVGQTYTYYYPDGSSRVAENEELSAVGAVWTAGKYVAPTHPSPVEVRVGNAGVKVWMVINWLRLAENDTRSLMERYGQLLQPEDVDAARWYYERNREAIDERIQEELEHA
jgi:uncharacterized protein (DUF433 family)